jgi:uncharacterized membrane protein YczE
MTKQSIVGVVVTGAALGAGVAGSSERVGESALLLALVLGVGIAVAGAIADIRQTNWAGKCLWSLTGLFWLSTSVAISLVTHALSLGVDAITWDLIVAFVGLAALLSAATHAIVIATLAVRRRTPMPAGRQAD